MVQRAVINGARKDGLDGDGGTRCRLQDGSLRRITFAGSEDRRQHFPTCIRCCHHRALQTYDEASDVVLFVSYKEALSHYREYALSVSSTHI